ncbi:MAG: hypothetical protein U0736_15100 [Gemmataceae bacterium]
MWSTAAAPAGSPAGVLDPAAYRHHVDGFNRDDRELYPQHIGNAAAWEFLQANVPLFDCPDRAIERTYYFRWWTFRKHLKRTPDGFVVTEFLPPVGWAGKHNTISCAAGHHFREGRWLADRRYLDDYATFWFRKGGEPRRYSFWAADAVWSRFLVTGDRRPVADLLPDLIANYEAWEKERRDPNGLFWQVDDRDGMEVSIGGAACPHGQGYRATINSYLYGDARAIARMATLLGKNDVAARFEAKAAEIRRLVLERLWDREAGFFKVLPRRPDARLVDVRELHGYTPWYFNLPDADRSGAWKQLLDVEGFRAPYGPTTAERRHRQFALSYRGHECQWNGPSWPYATAVTLTAMANLLHDYRQDVVSRRDYLDLLQTYARSHQLTRSDGSVVPWIDENLHPLTGDWIARTRLKTWKNGTWDAGKGGEERGKDYNHSTFCDLVISGLIGLRPREDDVVEVNPLVPAGGWDYFCLDRIRYHGHTLTVLYDRTGKRYGRGAGLRLLCDGQPLAATDRLGRLTARLPGAAEEETSAGWEKYSGNPVIGGKVGTCFDVSVLKEGDRYRMWLSWRPKASIAVAESRDGLTWGEPRIVLGPRKETGWEDDVNRPVVVRRDDGYHLWYTGQTRGRSAIGYATSRDGVVWKRMADRPVLAPAEPWEKGAVMCPHVLWDAAARRFRLWYSAGDQYEPDAVGYATSPDGLTWTRHKGNPIFKPDPKSLWERHKVTGVQVVPHGDGYLMFYIGFRDLHHAQIGVARSRDGVTGWERHPANPLLRPGRDRWDHDACYKPFALFDGKRWLLWYNGRRGSVEQIGVALHDGADLGFDRR